MSEEKQFKRPDYEIYGELQDIKKQTPEQNDEQRGEFERKLNGKFAALIDKAANKIDSALDKTTNAATLATVVGILTDKQQTLDVNKSLSREKEIEGILKIGASDIDIEIARMIFESPDLKNISEILEKLKFKRLAQKKKLENQKSQEKNIN